MRDGHVLLTLAALERALWVRSPSPGLIHHSDRGANYTSRRYLARLQEAGAVPSMSRKGDCWDNAVAESFFATLEFELLGNGPFDTRDEGRRALFEFIEVFYHTQRAHQTLDYRTPQQVERAYHMALI